MNEIYINGKPYREQALRDAESFLSMTQDIDPPNGMEEPAEIQTALDCIQHCLRTADRGETGSLYPARNEVLKSDTTVTVDSAGGADFATIQDALAEVPRRLYANYTVEVDEVSEVPD